MGALALVGHVADHEDGKEAEERGETQELDLLEYEPKSLPCWLDRSARSETAQLIWPRVA